MSARAAVWFDAPGLPRVAYGYAIRTGKMLQRDQEVADDKPVPYLKAMHVQQDAIVGLDDLPEMWASPADATAVGVRVGDLLVCEGGQIGRSALVSTQVPSDAVIEKSLHRIRSGRNSLRYLHYVLEVLRILGWFEAKSGSATLSHLTGEALSQLRIPLPVRRQQDLVAEYLDEETGRIDALIAAKRRMVDLLQEAQSALATDLLLGPPVRGGPAGPGQATLRPGWRLIPFRRLFREVDIRSETGSETLLSVSQTRGVIPRSDLGDRRQYAETLIGYKTCLARDLVVNRMWVYYGALGPVSTPGIVSPDYAVFRPTAQTSSEFAAYVLRTPAYVGEMTRLVRGIGAAFQGSVRKPRLHPSELGLIEMPVPPPAEEESVLHRLHHHADATTNRVALLNRSIDLLQERRHALISAAVTGQLDIPGAA